MLQLNLPNYHFRVKKSLDKYSIFDNLRKRYVALTPEEWVRQNFMRFLIEEKHFPASLFAVEHQLNFNGMKKRCDAVLFTHDANPFLILEFKAPTVRISQQTFDQVAVYNLKLRVHYFILSNGLEHYCCKLNFETNSYEFFTTIPDYNELQTSGL